MKILIIGGSRFVGPILINQLIANGHTITVFNRGQIQHTYKDNIAFIQGDRNQDFALPEHYDVVIDTCAYTGTQTKQAIEQLHFDFFVHFGTAAAYQKSELFPLTETSPLGSWPAWGSYNTGKGECEQVLQESNITYASIRPVYILGVNNYCDREHFIYKKIKDEQPIALPGNGEALVQFVFVEDVVKVFTTVIENHLTGAFNCSGNEIISLQGLVTHMGAILGKAPKLTFNPTTDGINWNEDAFPFANENFVCSNKKISEQGVHFTPLLEQLEKDFNAYYINTI